ncbi:LAQU0S18e01178g1_1 [Lachancea quebecensis]|uniref:LAQU0S18e01178g1_1 n=1 Tax=Lachancea quebecensis TaxID=1654605 RepID=A0A0N7MMB7_9SACH|nr:LAQU0S18e01178g1_1 [Lachancea quebecensis]
MQEPRNRCGVVTLVYSWAYLPGVLALGHQLQHALENSEHEFRTCVLVAKGLLEQKDASKQALLLVLESLYQDVIVVDATSTCSESLLKINKGNLELLRRPELAFTFMKLELWRLERFERIVYLDCDTLLLGDAFWDILDITKNQKRNEIGAVPDCGWPDMFNSGVLTVVPDPGVYAELTEYVMSNISIDGADQGVLNQFFNPNCRFGPHHGTLGVGNGWIRLPFTYNVTVPNAGYQNAPAVQFFRSQIRLVHFIGRDKPWITRSRALDRANDSYRDKWWQVYNEFLHKQTAKTPPQPVDGHPADDDVADTGSHAPDTSHDVSVTSSRPQSACQQAPAVFPAAAEDSGVALNAIKATPQNQPANTETLPSVPKIQPGADADPGTHLRAALDVLLKTPPTDTSIRNFPNDPPEIQASHTHQELLPSAWDATKSPPPHDGPAEAPNFSFNADYHWNESATLLEDELPKLKLGPNPIFPWELYTDAPEVQRVFPD